MDTFAFQGTLRRKVPVRHLHNPSEKLSELDQLLPSSWRRDEFDRDDDYLFVDVVAEDVYVSEDDMAEDSRDPQEIAEDRVLRELEAALDGSGWVLNGDLTAEEE